LRRITKKTQNGNAQQEVLKMNEELLKEKIKNKLGLKKWSVRCERVLEILLQQKVNEFIIHETSDKNFTTRNHQHWADGYEFHFIGARGTGKFYKGIFLCILS
jgi:hypothetical protein